MLADAALKANLISQKDHDRLLGAKGGGLYRALINEQLITEEKLRNFMSRAFGIQTIELAKVEVADSLASTFPATGVSPCSRVRAARAPPKDRRQGTHRFRKSSLPLH